MIVFLEGSLSEFLEDFLEEALVQTLHKFQEDFLDGISWGIYRIFMKESLEASQKSRNSRISEGFFEGLENSLKAFYFYSNLLLFFRN